MSAVRKNRPRAAAEHRAVFAPRAVPPRRRRGAQSGPGAPLGLPGGDRGSRRRRADRERGGAPGRQPGLRGAGVRRPRPHHYRPGPESRSRATRASRRGGHPARFLSAVQLRWLVLRAARPHGHAAVLRGQRGAARASTSTGTATSWSSLADRRGPALAGRALRRHRGGVHPRGIYEQRRLRPLGGQAPPEPAVRARGEEAPLEVVVEEAGCRFGVDVTAPLGVGFFPGPAGRPGRGRRARRRSPGAQSVLLHRGVFGPRGRTAGAQEVVAVDTRGQGARPRPPQLRAVAASIRRGSRRSPPTPARRWTVSHSRDRKFDLVICDPPTFSHARARARPSR